MRTSGHSLGGSRQVIYELIANQMVVDSIEKAV
jgi:hypothetical protein